MYLVSLGLAWVDWGMGALYVSILGLWGVAPLGAILHSCPTILPLISGF